MGDRKGGFTLVEVMAVIGILAIVMAAGGIVLPAVVRGARAAAVANQLANDLALVRERSLARSEPWRISFDGTSPSRSYRIESCPGCAAGVAAGWKVQQSVGAPTGMGFALTGPDVIAFRPGGWTGNTDETEVRVCQLMNDQDGREICDPTKFQRRMQIHGRTGLIDR